MRPLIKQQNEPFQLNNPWVRDPVVRQFGGIVEKTVPDSIDNWLIGQLDHVYKENLKWLDSKVDGLDLDEIDLLVTSGTEVTALAYRKGKRRAIILTQGLLRAMWEPIRIGSHVPTVLSEALPQSLSSIKAGVPNKEILPTEWELPAERVDFFLQVYCFMLEYVTLHEMAHHTRGHLDKGVLKGKAIALLDERYTRQEPEIKSHEVTERDTEFDADAAGLNLSLNAFNNRYPIRNWSQDDALDQLFLLLFSQLLVAQQLDSDSDSPVSANADEHPSPVYRSISYSNLVTKNLHRLVDGDWADFRIQHDAAWSEASFLAEAMPQQRQHWYGHDIEALYLANFREQESDFFRASSQIDQFRSEAE